MKLRKRRYIGIAFSLLVALTFVIQATFTYAACHRSTIDRGHKANKSHLRKQRVLPEPNHTARTHQTVAQLLGWVPSHDPNNVCRGYFKQVDVVHDYPNPPPMDELPTVITSEGPTLYKQKGESILEKNVVVTQTGRRIKADKAYIYRNRKTGKISRITLVGHVRLREAGKLVVGHYGTITFPNHVIHFKHALYHIYHYYPHMGFFDAWGKAKLVRRLKSGVLLLWDATYTTCSPVHPTWELSASFLHLDKKKGEGYARNAVLRYQGVPILFTPYYSFPLNDNRKSGFLAPVFSYSKEKGLDVRVPYYWNMAPNYDSTITARYMAKRGLQFNTLFRYITHSSNGSVYVSYIPYDKEFASYRRQMIQQFGGVPGFVPFVNALRNDHNGRGYFAVESKTHFNRYWSLRLNGNYVTDSYYFKDFGQNFLIVNGNQLVNQIELAYEGLHWDIVGLARAFQTLHLIDQSSGTNQYMRLPEFDFSGHYPDEIAGVNFQFSGQAVNFAYDSLFPPFTFQQPIGQRLHLRPGMSRPFNWASGFFTPAVYVDSTSYEAKLAAANAISSRPNFSGTRVLPIFDLDSGLYFDRDFHLFHHSYIQTLEPQIFYLYVPFLNQNKYPVFDTEKFPFSYEQLFSLNRFVGFDRLENANQVSLGLTTRILNGETAEKILQLDLGFIYYFEQPKISLNNQPLLFRRISPIAARLIYYVTSHLSLRGNLAWDAHFDQMNNTEATLVYTNGDKKVIDLSYEFVHGPNTEPVNSLGFSTNSNLFKIGFSWPLTRKWSAVGYWYYNISDRRPEEYYGGLEYDTCCVAIRILADRTHISNAPITQARQYRTAYFVQLQLKGLGDVVTGGAHQLLARTIPDLKDQFYY